MDYSNLLMVLGSLVLAAGATFIVWKRIKATKQGFAIEDELSKAQGFKAGYFAYLISVWVAVGCLWFNVFAENSGLTELTAGQVVGAVVLIPGMVFLALAIYMNYGKN